MQVQKYDFFQRKQIFATIKLFIRRHRTIISLTQLLVKMVLEILEITLIDNPKSKFASRYLLNKDDELCSLPTC